jgi:type I restriction enzyme S subunit
MSDEKTSLALLRIADMNSGIKEIFMSEKTPEQYIAKKEDIIYTRTGQVGLVFRNQEGVVHNNCFRVFPKDEAELTKNYLYWVLKSDIFFQYANLLAWGSAQSDLSHSSFKKIEITLFPIEEQNLIVKYLENKFSQIEELIKEKKLQIEKIEIYKKSVIYEYVTGKKRVKGAEELYG